MKRWLGFTLIELLVVIAILSLLATLLFPVFARAKASAKQSACLTNLKQIGASLSLYMGDYDDVFPHALDASDKVCPQIWDAHPEFQARIPTMPMLQEVLEPYLKSKESFRCPSDTGIDMLDFNYPITLPSEPSTYNLYGSSYLFRTEIAFRQYTQSTFRLPAEVNVFFDASGSWHGNGRKLHYDDDFETYLRLTRGYKYNTLFGDLHAKSLSFGGLERAWAIEL